MGEKEGKVREQIDREKGNRIDESRDVSKMQSPEKWPDPPDKGDGDQNNSGEDS